MQLIYNIAVDIVFIIFNKNLYCHPPPLEILVTPRADTGMLCICYSMLQQKELTYVINYADNNFYFYFLLLISNKSH